MNIVLLDKITIGNDIDDTALEQYGQVTVYQNSTPEEIRERIVDADILIGNKILFCEEVLKVAKHLKLICVTGTGYNNVDITYARENQIGVCNIPAYSTDSVAQHTFALLFRFMEKIADYEKKVQDRSFIGKDVYSNLVPNHFFELRNKTWGIVGMGNIGRQVAEIAAAFGCNVLYFSTSGITRSDKYKMVPLEELMKQSDILSIHAPMNDTTRNLITKEQISLMKSSACIINVGRGGIVNEADLVEAIQEGTIAGACIDVYEKEPIAADSPYLTIQNYDNLILTPHIAWGAKEARQRAIDETVENIKAFVKGDKRCRVV